VVCFHFSQQKKKFFYFYFISGQHLRVGKAITPPEGLFASAQSIGSPMPTATALAVATITAQLQAKDVETNQQPTVVCLF
jgi:hypothetical protein